MKSWLIRKVLKMVSFDTLVKMIAQAIAYLIAYARKNSSDEGWEKAKSAVKQLKNWLALFDEVYEDDNLTEEEEVKIQDAIADCTLTTSIYNIVQGKKFTARRPKSARKPRKTTLSNAK